MESDSVNRGAFEEKMKEVYSNRNSNRSVWDKKQLEKAKLVLKDGGTESKRVKSYYHFSKHYELYEVGESECHVIAKRTNKSDKVIYVIPFEDYYVKLLEAHVQTGHGGRDKMLYYIKNRWRISRIACEIFLSCCETCNLKKTQIRKGVVVKPIVSNGFNARGQVDLIDFQSCPDGDYNWLLNYQDHATKFLHLRPLKSKHATNVANELVKIFFTFSAPCILQSDNGREFVAKVIEELIEIWPHCKIVHGRPRHPQSQGSVERANADVENMLRAWMIDRKSTNWSQGCYEVQWLKNTSKHRIINRTPYEAVLGPIHCGVASLSLPDDVLNTLHTEEDLEKVLAELNKKVDVSSDGQNFIQYPEASSSSVTSDNQTSTVCGVCDKILIFNDAVTCTKCNLTMHADCSELDLSTDDELICSLCARGKRLLQNQQDCFNKQQVAAAKMITFSEEIFPQLSVNDCVTVSVPDVDRGPLDLRAIFGVVTDFRNGVYQVGTKDGLIKGWFPRNKLNLSGTKTVTIDDVPNEVLLTLREAATRQSICGGQGYQKCNCKANPKQCCTSRCSCFKLNMKCNSRCHQSLTCFNK